MFWGRGGIIFYYELNICIRNLFFVDYFLFLLCYWYEIIFVIGNKYFYKEMRKLKVLLFGIKYLYKKVRIFNNNLLMIFCFLLCIDVGVDGEEVSFYEGRV